MATIQRFEDLKVWKIAHELTRKIYELTGQGRFSRDYGLRNQIRRASVSMISNISEGFESQTQSLFMLNSKGEKSGVKLEGDLLPEA